MFASNVTPAFIIAGAAGLAGADLVYMVQMAMVFSGIATLIQTVGIGPVGAKLPIVQGTSFAFIPVMIPVAKAAGMGAVLGGAVIGGIFHFFLGTVVLTIGLALIPVAIKYSAGGVPLQGQPEFGTFQHWGLALLVIVVTLGIKFFARGIMTAAAGLRMIGEVEMNRRNMVILAVSLAIGLGLQAVPGSLQHLPDTLKILLTSGLLPAAFLAVTLNALLPKELRE